MVDRVDIGDETAGCRLPSMVEEQQVVPGKILNANEAVAKQDVWNLAAVDSDPEAAVERPEVGKPSVALFPVVQRADEAPEPVPACCVLGHCRCFEANKCIMHSHLSTVGVGHA